MSDNKSEAPTQAPHGRGDHQRGSHDIRRVYAHRRGLAGGNEARRMTIPAGAPIGRPPALTPEQDREIFEKVQLRKRLAKKCLAADYGVSVWSLDFAVARERRRRSA